MGISRYNPSGCYDPTAYEALNNIIHKPKRDKAASRKELNDKCWVCHYRGRCNKAFRRQAPCKKWKMREW